MNWGDVPAWAAFALSGGAVWVSIKARQDGKRSAAASETSAVASVRSAVAAEESLALQRQEAQERRDAEDEAARPRVELVLERPGGQRQFVLRNIGTATAEGVTITQAGEDGQGRDLPEGVTLHEGEGHPFFVVASAGLAMPTRIYVKWNGQDEPVPLGVPSR